MIQSKKGKTVKTEYYEDKKTLKFIDKTFSVRQQKSKWIRSLTKKAIEELKAKRKSNA